MRNNTTPYTRHSGAPARYHMRLQAAAEALWTAGAGAEPALCPRDGCTEALQSSTDGAVSIVRCPRCGVIFRGNRNALLRMI